MKQIDIREGARRQHRTISLFAVLQCWQRGLDGLYFERHDLQRLIGLERFKSKRVAWLQEDLTEFFPHQDVTWSGPKKDSFERLTMSRLPLDVSSSKHATEGTKRKPIINFFHMWRLQRKDQVHELFKIAIPFFADHANYDERFLSAFLALLAQGQISAKHIPGLGGDFSKQIAKGGKEDLTL